jgi:hypothetical protein
VPRLCIVQYCSSTPSTPISILSGKPCSYAALFLSGGGGGRRGEGTILS